MRLLRELAVPGALIGCLGVGSAGASESAAPASRRLAITVLTEGGGEPFDAAVIAVATRNESGAWSSAGRLRTDSAGRSSLELAAAVSAVHVLVVCPQAERLLSGDAVLDLTRAGSAPLDLEVSIESGSDAAVDCSPPVAEKVSAPRWPRPLPFPRRPRWPPRWPEPEHCDPLPCPNPKVDAT